MFMKRVVIALSALATGFAVAPALAQPAPDPQSLAYFAPMETQDALVVPTGNFESQNFAYTSTISTVRPVPRSLSSARRSRSARFTTFNWTSRRRNGYGGNTPNAGVVGFDGYYQFNDPRPNFPALAAKAGYTPIEYGPGRTSNSYFLRGLLTQWLGPDDHAPRLDLTSTGPTTPSRLRTPAATYSVSALATPGG